VGDFNGDGIQDLALLCLTTPIVESGVPGSVAILIGNGDGTFTLQAASPATGDFPVSLVTGDLNGDGILDLAVMDANYDDGYDNGRMGYLTILMGNGDGTFTPTPESPSTNGQGSDSIAAGDFNGDGIPDLVTANGASDTETVLLGQGDGTFGQPIIVPTGKSPGPVSTGDFNGDGLTDFAVVNGLSNSLSMVLTELTKTSIAEAKSISLLGTGTREVAAR
jgi:hypothetical protein